MNAKIEIKKECINVGLLLLACIAGAIGMHVFVYPSNFAPMGIDGIATMLQALTVRRYCLDCHLQGNPKNGLVKCCLKLFYLHWKLSER